MAQDGIASGQQLDERATQQFRQADTDRDGAVNLKEFVAYCHSNSASRARLELRSSLGPSSESEPLACISQMQTLSQKPRSCGSLHNVLATDIVCSRHQHCQQQDRT